MVGKRTFLFHRLVTESALRKLTTGDVTALDGGLVI